MKKLFLSVFVFALLLLNFSFIFAQKKIEVYFFYSLTCPHCAKEKIFLERLEKRYPEIEIKKFSLAEKKNIELLNSFYEKYEVPVQKRGLVPITFIEKKYFLGFSGKIGRDIESYILQFINEVSSEEQPSAEGVSEEKIEIPILGKIDPQKFSLPLLAVILGFFDGFNVCSLGALVLILGIVLALRSRSKILILGGIFLLTTGLIYGILIVFWHRLFLALAPHLRKMEIVIGTLAILGGLHFLREFLKFKKRGPVCEFGGISQKFSQKIQKVFEKKAGILTLAGAVFLFSAIITIVEFPCSAALPLVFAGILTKAKISTILSLFYIGIFLIFYLLDEILVFLISVFTLKLWIASPKFVTFLNLVAGIILFFLGFYYLFGLI